MLASKSDLLANCVSERQTKIITLSSGDEVKIQCLDGRDRLIVVDLSNDLPLRVSHAIKQGLIEPALSSREVNGLIKDGGDISQDLFTAILELSGELTQDEAEAKIEAEKK